MSNDHDEMRSALEQLAGRYGIGVKYENALGRHVSVPSETIQLLLASMGVAASDEAEVQAALEEFDGQAAARAVPASIVVVPHDGVCAISVKLPEGAKQFAWQVTLEDGGEVGGTEEALDPDGDGKVTLRIPDLPLGYHQLRLPEHGAEAHLIVSPGQCWLPPDAEKGHWGIAVQLYLMRSANNWGIGDFSDLRALIQAAAPRGCAVIGLNPLHQMFLDDPEAASPYSPATRLYLNPLYIDVTAVPEFGDSPDAQALVASPDFQRRLAECRAAKLVDYTAVTALKLDALQLLFEAFAKAPAERKDALAQFRAQKGESLERAALFQVLRQHFGAEDPEQASWQNWPSDMQTVGSDAQRQFARQHRAEIDLQVYLQFLADEQLAQAAKEARHHGIPIGLYRDLAVGCARSGAETWANPPAFLQNTLVGAPPDIFNPAGQNWGLPPFDPTGLHREGYQSFVELIRSNMLHAGGLRIDHVMGLARLYCIPEGKSSAEGAYVSFPLDDLIGVLALESQRQQCLVVGEDLGTVPPGFREQLAAANILSYRVLFFEQDFHTGSFVPPSHYPHLALAVTGSHDLPTLEAWWEGADLALKESLGLFGDAEETRSQQERRDRERQNILAAFAKAGLFEHPPAIAEISPEQFAEDAHRFLGLTKSMLLVTQLDDLTRDIAPVNVPGTSTEHANWRRKYAMTMEDLAADPEPWKLVEPLQRAG